MKIRGLSDVYIKKKSGNAFIEGKTLFCEGFRLYPPTGLRELN